MSRVVVALFGVIILAFVGVFAFQAALADAGETHTITNETWVPDAGNFTTLNESNISHAYYDANVTVFDENDTLMDNSDDYEWNNSKGEGKVKAVTGGDLDGDANATISYSYQLATQDMRQLTQLLSQGPRWLGLLLPVFVALLFLRFML